MSFKRFCSKISKNAQFAFLHCPVRGTLLLGLSSSSILEYECKGNSRTSLSKYVYLFFQVKDDKPVRPKSAILPEKDYSLSELLSQVDSGISRSFDRVKEDSCHSKENTCKRLSGISSADSAFSSQDSITLSFEKENSCGKSFSRHTTGNIIPENLKILKLDGYLCLYLKFMLSFATGQILLKSRSGSCVTLSGPETLPS